MDEMDGMDAPREGGSASPGTGAHPDPARPTPLPSPLTTEQLARLESICTGVARRLQHLFASHRSVTLDDLVQVALTGFVQGKIAGALRAHANYSALSTYGDGTVSAYTSWIGKGASGALIDYARSLTAELRRQEAYRGKEHHYPAFRPPEQTLGPEMPPEFSEIPPRLHRYFGGRLGHPVTAYLAALAYRERHGLSWRKFHRRLQGDPALVRTLGFARCPSRSSILDAARRLREWGREQRAH